MVFPSEAMDSFGGAVASVATTRVPLSLIFCGTREAIESSLAIGVICSLPMFVVDSLSGIFVPQAAKEHNTAEMVMHVTMVRKIGCREFCCA